MINFLDRYNIVKSISLPVIKKIMLIAFFSSSTFYSDAQINKTETAFLDKLIRESQPEGKIIYTNKINKSDLEYVTSKIKRSYIYGITNETRQNNIVLTRQEKKYLKEQLENSINPIWKENLFTNSVIINEEDLISYIKNSYKEYLEKYNNPANTEEDRMTMVKNYQRTIVYKFSPPVYLRDKTIFLLYFSSTCGRPCGFEELAFYRYENYQWKKWIVVNHSEY